MADAGVGSDWHAIAGTVAPDVRPFVDGRRVEALTERLFVVENSYSGKTIATVADCEEADVDRAVAAARTAFDAGIWADMPPVERGRILRRWADLMLADREMAVLQTMQMGMPIALSTLDIPDASQLLRDCAELAEQHRNTLLPGAAMVLSMEIRRPQGVVAIISPWNFPVGVALTMIAPAIAAGNSVVLKPSEVSPIGCLRLAELAIEAGLPAGVFNVVPGLGASTGRLLALHRDVDFLSFTGSTATGKMLMQYSGQSNMKNMLLECGGKSPQIVFDDLGDIGALADALVQGFTFNSGQVCTSGSRMLVASTLYDRLMPLLIDRVNACRTGDPLDPSTKLGPLASTEQARRFRASIDAVGDDVRLLAQGGTGRDDGNEVAPLLLETRTLSSPVVQDEVFGPLSVVTPFRDEEEAIRLANGTPYGLSATIWASDVTAWQRMLPRLRIGVVLANRVPDPTPAGIRFISCEPFKMSGFGAHGGVAGLKAYTRIQAAILSLA